MSRNAVRWLIGLVLGTTLSLGMFAAGFLSGQVVQLLPGTATLPARLETPVGSLPLVPPTEPSTNTPGASADLFDPFWEAWRLVHDEFVDQPLDDTRLMQGAIEGMLEATGDEYTSYMDPNQYRIATSDLAGELEGIGAEVDVSGETVTIVSPLPGTPAEAAGLKPGDKIVEVDGEDVTRLDGYDVIFKVRGPAGTTVRLGILREGEPELLHFSIVRALIVIPSVEWRMLEDGLAYVKINQFGDKTSGDLHTALADLLAQNPDGLILDLRGNPGGLLSTAIDVASEFVESGVLVVERYGDGREDTFEARGDGLATEVPLVVLINMGSASASEIVAGAVQDYERGLLIGEASFGKGSVQNWHPLGNGQGAVRITIARWLTPDGRQIQGQGLEPDVPVELTDDDREADRDPQLDAAIEALRNPTGG